MEAAVWGPFATQINGSIGETIGIVQNESFTLGIQALNPKTLGGYPWKDNDHLPQMDIFEQEDFEDVTHAKRGVLYSVEAAKPTEYGSSLQAYTRNRSKDRVIENWDHQRYVAPALADGGLIGSKIALFGCKTANTLQTIGEIEVAEGLPHPMIDGVWVKQSPVINSSYLIMDFDETNVDECLGYAKQACFFSLPTTRRRSERLHRSRPRRRPQSNRVQVGSILSGGLSLLRSHFRQQRN